WLQIVRDTIEIPLGHGSRRGRQNRPALCALRSFWLSINKQIERLQRADRNVLEHKVAVGRQRQSFDNRPGFFNRCGVHKEDHAARLILAEPELVDLPVEIELQSVGDFLRQDPLPLLVRERPGKQTQSKNLHDCSPCSIPPPGTAPLLSRVWSS